MPEDTCAPRIASLSEQAKALERRASELATQQDDDDQPERARTADLHAPTYATRSTTATPSA